jgi:hypothetical protein
MVNNFQDTFYSREGRYSIGMGPENGLYYLSIPVSNRMADYEEYYKIDQSQYSAFLENNQDALAFADECRRREHDALLIVEPGSDRGWG